MTRTCWTAPGEGATVGELVAAAEHSLPLAASVARAALEARPGTRWEDLLHLRTNVKLLADRWGPEDLERIEKLEVKA